MKIIFRIEDNERQMHDIIDFKKDYALDSLGKKIAYEDINAVYVKPNEFKKMYFGEEKVEKKVTKKSEEGN